MKNTNRQPSSGSVLLGMAAGAALGAVGTMAMAQNQRQVKRTARKLAHGAFRALGQLVDGLAHHALVLGGKADGRRTHSHADSSAGHCRKLQNNASFSGPRA